MDPTLIQLLQQQQQALDWQQFLQASLTDKELEMLRERWAIFARLRSGQPQRIIAQELRAGIATVTRGAKAYRQQRAYIDGQLAALPPDALAALLQLPNID
jgi:Trp operon repressor